MHERKYLPLPSLHVSLLIEFTLENRGFLAEQC
jgi:hypothetical protein